MPLSVVSDIGWYIQQLSGSVATAGSSDGSANATRVTNASAAGAANTAALGQNLQIFMQALYQALSMVDSTTAPTAAAGGAEDPDFGATVGPTYAKLQPAYVRPHSYQHDQNPMNGKIGSLISALKQQGGSSTNAPPASEGSLAGLQAAFNRLLQDLGGRNQGSLQAIPLSSNALDALSGQGSELTLQRWLQGLQQSLRQPGTTSFRVAGNIIDITV